MRLPPSRSRDEVGGRGEGKLSSRLCPRGCIQQMREARVRLMLKKKSGIVQRIEKVLLPLVESQQFVGRWIDAVHVPMRCQSCGQEATTKTTTTTTTPLPPPPGAASPPFPLATSAQTSLRRAQNSAQLLRQDARLPLSPCARTRVRCCYCCFSAQRRRG